MSYDPPGFRNTCLLPLLLGPVLFGVLCIGASIVNYFHAREAVTLPGIFFFSLVIGFLAALILFGILHACRLNSYVEREVKQEFRERFCYTIFGCVLVLCTLITFFGCFGEVVGKTWDNMDIGVRNDEWASVETLKEEKKYGRSTSASSYKSSDVFDAISNYRPSRSSSSDTRSAVSSETNTQAAPHAKEEQKTHSISERITDSDWECADGCEQEDFWITEEDDETHNSSCPRYGEGEGLYSAQGSGTDCTECGGAK